MRRRHRNLYFIAAIILATAILQIALYTFRIYSKVEETKNSCSTVLTTLQNWGLDNENQDKNQK